MFGWAHEALDVARVHGAAVQHAHLLGDLRAVQVGERRADGGADGLGLLGRGRAPRADGPDGLVGHHAALRVGGVHAGERGAHLGAHELLGGALVAHGQRLAHAHDGVQARLDERLHLAVHVLVRLAEQLAALGVANDAARAADLLDHGHRDLSGVGAGGLPVHVLGVHGHLRLVEVEHGLGRLEVDVGRADDDVDVLAPGLLVVLVGDLLRQHHGLGDGVVHLPVACHHGFARHANFLSIETPRTGTVPVRGNRLLATSTPRRPGAPRPARAPWRRRRRWR